MSDDILSTTIGIGGGSGQLQIPVSAGVRAMFSALFGNGALGDVVSGDDPDFGGVKDYVSLTIGEGVTCTVSAAPNGLKTLIARAQSEITVAGTIDATGALVPSLVLTSGASFSGGGGGGGGGGNGNGNTNFGQQGNGGQSNGGGGANLGGGLPDSFGSPGQGGNSGSPGTPGGNGTPSVPASMPETSSPLAPGFDPDFIQQYMQFPGGWLLLIAGGTFGNSGGQGGQGGSGGFGTPGPNSEGGQGGNGGQGGQGGAGGGAIVLIAPTVTIKATAVLRSRGTNGTDAPTDPLHGGPQPGFNAPDATNSAGGGGGGGGGEGGQGGNGGAIVIVAQHIVIEPGATFDTAPGAGGNSAPGAGGGMGGTGGAGGANGGAGGNGSHASATLAGPILQVQL